MKTNIGGNIRALRKERSLTQEQLAEALGVTVGAVSKWESGASIPEVGLIMELADFFETSVDALLGYEWRGGSMEKVAERIKTAMLEKRFDAGMNEAEKGLQKFPNSFEVVYRSAGVYCMAGIERGDKRALRRALELYQRSCGLIGLNSDDKISELSIQSQIASLYLMLGETDKGLEQYRRNNPAGLNDWAIGCTLAGVKHEPDEALPYLASALLDSVTTILRVCGGYIDAYSAKGEQRKGLELLDWACGFMEGLKPEECVSYLDRGETMLLSMAAALAAEADDWDAVRRYLEKAAALAFAFDSAPIYSMSNIKFYHGKEATSFDDFGSNTVDAVAKQLGAQDDNRDRLLTVWHELTDCKEH